MIDDIDEMKLAIHLTKIMHINKTNISSLIKPGGKVDHMNGTYITNYLTKVHLESQAETKHNNIS